MGLIRDLSAWQTRRASRPIRIQDLGSDYIFVGFSQQRPCLVTKRIGKAGFELCVIFFIFKVTTMNNTRYFYPFFSARPNCAAGQESRVSGPQYIEQEKESQQSDWSQIKRQ